MAGQRIGYVRVSTLDQNEKRQLEGQVLDRVFMDKASGRDTARPQLTELLRFARDGDTVVVHSMDRQDKKDGIASASSATLQRSETDPLTRRERAELSR